MKFLSLLLGILCLSKTFTGQKTDIAISVGDKIPDAFVQLYSGKSAQQTTMKKIRGGRYMIIDLFATWCAPCIGQFPNFNYLSEKYKDRLSIIPVTNESISKWAEFSSTNKYLASNKLPVIVADKKLQQWFPHTMVPHEIWIDNEGVVKYISSFTDVTEKNVEQFVNGKELALAKKGDVINFDYNLPLQTHDSGFYFRSVLTEHKPGLPAMTYDDTDPNDVYAGKVSRVLYTNLSLSAIYYFAYRYGGPAIFNLTNIELDVKDSSAYLFPHTMGIRSAQENMAWMENHTYCYERCNPTKIPDTAFFTSVINDLNSVGPLQGTIVKRLRPVWLLVKNDQAENLLKTKGQQSQVLWDKGDFVGLRNMPLKSFVRHLNAYMDNYSIIDETNINEQVDMMVSVPAGDGNNHLDIPIVQTGLRKYGLDLVLAERLIDVLHLTDKQK